MPQVRVPTPFRGPTRGEEKIQVEGSTVRACVEAVAERYPGFRELIFDPRGNLNRFVRLFLDGEGVPSDALVRSVGESDEVEILSAIAGG